MLLENGVSFEEISEGDSSYEIKCCIIWGEPSIETIVRNSIYRTMDNKKKNLLEFFKDNGIFVNSYCQSIKDYINAIHPNQQQNIKSKEELLKEEKEFFNIKKQDLVNKLNENGLKYREDKNYWDFFLYSYHNSNVDYSQIIENETRYTKNQRLEQLELKKHNLEYRKTSETFNRYIETYKYDQQDNLPSFDEIIKEEKKILENEKNKFIKELSNKGLCYSKHLFDELFYKSFIHNGNFNDIMNLALEMALDKKKQQILNQLNSQNFVFNLDIYIYNKKVNYKYTNFIKYIKINITTDDVIQEAKEFEKTIKSDFIQSLIEGLSAESIRPSIFKTPLVINHLKYEHNNFDLIIKHEKKILKNKKYYYH